MSTGDSAQEASRNLSHGPEAFRNCSAPLHLCGSMKDLSFAADWNRSYVKKASLQRFGYSSGAGPTRYSIVLARPTSSIACWHLTLTMPIQS